jgi:hypothetical protein
MEYLWSNTRPIRQQRAANKLSTGFQQACAAVPVPQGRHAPCLIPAEIYPALGCSKGLRLFSASLVSRAHESFGNLSTCPHGGWVPWKFATREWGEFLPKAGFLGCLHYDVLLFEADRSVAQCAMGLINVESVIASAR